MANEITLNSDGSISQTLIDLGNSFASATISSGAITYSASLMTIDTEGSAALDELATINSGDTAKLLIVKIANNARQVVVKHGTGNIYSSGGDITLDSTSRLLMLAYQGSVWAVIGCCGDGDVVDPLESGDIDEGETVRCVAAGRVRAFLEEVFGAARTNITGSVASIAAAMNNVIRLVCTPSNTAVLALAAALEADYADTTAFDADFTSGVYDVAEEIIYCADTDEDGVYSAAEIAQIAAQITAETGAVYDYITDLVTIMGAVGLSNAVGASALTSNNCDGYCSDWCYTFSFTSDEEGWTLPYSPTYGEYDSPDFVSNLDGATFAVAVWIRKTFTATYISQISMVYSVTVGTIAGTMDTGIVYGNGSFNADYFQTTVNETNETYTVYPNATIDRIELGGHAGNGAGSDPGGEFRIHSVMVMGSGTNPFGSDNC